MFWLLLLPGTPPEIRNGAVVKGYVLYADSGRGLAVQLSHGYKGHVTLTDIWDAYKDRPVSKYHVNQVVKCCVIKCDKKNPEKCVLSLRKSRWVSWKMKRLTSLSHDKHQSCVAAYSKWTIPSDDVAGMKDLYSVIIYIAQLPLTLPWYWDHLFLKATFPLFQLMLLHIK